MTIHIPMIEMTLAPVEVTVKVEVVVVPNRDREPRTSKTDWTNIRITFEYSYTVLKPSKQVAAL